MSVSNAVATMSPAQRAAVEHQNGPMLVLAGAGSGKTRVITHRIARLVSLGVPAPAICALTFTNKAAGEMSERVDHLLRRVTPDDAKRSPRGASARASVMVSTFHAFGLMVLGRERASLGGAFTIFDQGDCIAAVKEILSRTPSERSYDASAVLARISAAKNGFVRPEEMKPREGDDYDEVAARVYPRYEAALRNFHAFDFDDLVCRVAQLWTERSDVLERWQSQFLYILVDEYQDTNRAQLELLKLLAGQHRNLCVVGDDDQSIYAWRGADVRNILAFEDHFPGARVVKLEQNYRSTSPILNMANAVIAKRLDAKYPKVLFTERPGGSAVRLGVASSAEEEATYVAREIRRRLREEGRKPKDFAVLYRSNAQAKLVEESLREQGVAYRMIGGQQFFERKEVKDVLAYLKLALNPLDEISLRRIINAPPRGIGETSVERLSQYALARSWSLWQTIERVDGLDGISGPAREGCKSLEKVILDIRSKLRGRSAQPSSIVREVCDTVGFRKDIESTSPSSKAAARRWGNVEGLFATLGRREQRVEAAGKDASEARDLMAFLHALTLQMNDDEEPGNVVTLSTLHGAKGLEFGVVYLMGCEEGFLPHTRTLDTRATDVDGGAEDIEEERRLFYVGITRAKDHLEILRCRHRVSRGKPIPRVPSRFLLDLPEALAEPFDIQGAALLSAGEMAENASNLLAMLDGLGKA